MGFYVDFDSWTLDELKSNLRDAYLVPSRRLLQTGIDPAFAGIKAQGIETVAELFEVLKTKTRLAGFVQKSGVDEDYLRILGTELRSYRARPSKLGEFPETPEKASRRLAKVGVGNAQQLYERALLPIDRARLVKEAGLLEREVTRLAQLADLSRIRWVNHTFAYVLYEAGYSTVEKVAAADYKRLYETIIALNKERDLYRGNIGLNDMKLCVTYAAQLSIDMQFN